MSGTKKGRLSAKVSALINKQIEIEFGASQVYHAMAVWAEWKGYTGTAKFLFKHVNEERAHMNRLIEYMLDRNELPRIPTCGTQPSDFTDLKGILTAALDHELMVTASYIKAHDIVCAEKDMLTEEFLRFYFNEQKEEEAIYLSLLDRLEIIGNDKKGQYFLDTEIAELA